jgi:hypothetical protein
MSMPPLGDQSNFPFMVVVKRSISFQGNVSFRFIIYARRV